MSHHGLQQAVVVALHSPAFVDALREDADAALAPFDITPEERAHLLAVDPRAFGVDAARSRRVLRAIVDELKASTTIALAETRSFAFALEFFAAPAFRDAVIAGTPLVLAFGHYLATAADAGVLRTPQLPDVIRLELTRAQCRRTAADAPARGIALAPGVAVLALDGNTLACVQRMEQYLFDIGLIPQLAVCDDAPRPPQLPPLGAVPAAHLQLAPQPGGGDIALTPIDEPLYRVLDVLSVARPRAGAESAIAPLVPRGAASRVIDGLIEDGAVAKG